MKKIIATIDPRTGRISIRTEGYKGADCLKATAALEEGLGLDTSERELTADYHQTTEQQEGQKT